MAALTKGQKDTIIASRVIAAGAFATPLVDVPANVTRIDIEMDRSTWPDTGADVIECDIRESLDGTVDNSVVLFSFRARGGVFVDASKPGLVGTVVRAAGFNVRPGSQIFALGRAYVALTTDLKITAR